VPSYSPTTTAYAARNGNTVAALIGTSLVAMAQQVTHGFPLGTEGIYGVGSAKPQEIQQLRVSPHITLEMFALTQTGINLLEGGQTLSYILANNQFDFYVLDGNNQQVLFVYVGCQAQDFTESVPTNQMVRDTITFLALDVLNNQGNSILNVPSAFTPPTTQTAASAAQAQAGSLGLPPATGG
jgi:hypothetical protein